MSSARELSQLAPLVTVDANNKITFASSSEVDIGGVVFPTVDGSNGQVLTTDGSGNLTFADMRYLVGFFGDDVSLSSYGDGGDLSNPGNIFIKTYAEGGTRGDVIIQDLKYPQSDGSNGQVLTTDGSGNLSFADAAGSYGDSDVGTYLSTNGYDTATNIISSITDSAPATLDTLNELAAALGDDPNFATTVTNSIAAKIGNVVEDTTPQLGGDLDLNLKSFSGTASFKSGPFELLKISDGAALTMVESNVHPLLINTSNTSISLTAGTSESGGGSINLRTENQSRIEIANTGTITFNSSYTFPTSDGTEGTVLTTNGSGTLSWSTPAAGYSNSDVDTHLNTSTATQDQVLSWNGSDYDWLSLPSAGGIENVVEDTTPQLGGNLDLNSKTINGSGNISYTGNFLNSGNYQTNLLSGNAFTILGSTDNNTLSIGHSGNISLNQSGSGSITFFNAYSFPTSDGTEGTVLTTNGSGTLSWSTPSSGGISNVVEDTTPQLGGNLDVNEFNIIGGTSQYDFLNLNGAENASDGAIWMSGSYSGANGTVNIAGSNGASGGTVKINYMGNNGFAYGTTYIGSLYSETFYDNEVYIVNSKWPQSLGSNGQVLTTDGAGTLSWADASGGSSFTASLFHTLDNPNAYGTSEFDNFGFSVAVSGNYAIVGASQEEDAGGTFSGKAYIYNVSTGALVHTLDNPNAYSTSQSDRFGQSVAISGNYAIVGAQYEDEAGGTSSGKAYIFNVSTGALVHTLNNPNAYSTVGSDRFGQSVAISGNHAIVGASQEDDAGGTSSGKAYIFNVTTGALVHTLNNPNAYSTSGSDQFGQSVAISGNYAIVGAYQEDELSGTNSGKAYIFNASTGALVHTLDNPNPETTWNDDYFGWSVAISGNYAIVGAYREDEPAGTDSGKAYIFNVSTGALVATLDNPNPYSTISNDVFGYTVSISGNYAIVGAHQEDEAGATSSGKAYIFDVTTGTLVATLDNPNAYSASADDRFGWSVAISGNYAIVGAYSEDDAGGSESGKAYMYQLPNAQPYVLDAAETAGFSGGSFADRYVAAIVFG